MAPTKNGLYEPGGEYLVTEVLTWWMNEIREEPEWLPVMGSLHHDREFFEIEDLHYHIDPRFLAGAAAERAQGRLELDRSLDREAWHPAFQAIASWFPYTDENGRPLAFCLTDQETRVADRNLQRVGGSKTADWGLARIQRRTTRLICRRALEPPTINGDYNDSPFRGLRRHYGRKCRDICPHRGYDLTTVPVDDKGYRQCPLHQLRVRVPKRRRPGKPTETTASR